MTIDPTRSIAEIVAEIPGATGVFEKLGVDYCCGGNRPLEDACASAGAPLGEVVRSLEEAGQKPPERQADYGDRQSEPLSDLICYIINKHHTFARRELARIEQLLAKVCLAHGDHRPDLPHVQDLFRRLSGELLEHMRKEEQVLFPFIARMEQATARKEPLPEALFGTVHNPIEVMMREHDATGDILRQIRAATSNYTPVAKACTSFTNLYQFLRGFEEDLHRHIYLENSFLFPRAVQLEGSAGRETKQARACPPSATGL